MLFLCIYSINRTHLLTPQYETVHKCIGIYLSMEKRLSRDCHTRWLAREQKQVTASSVQIRADIWLNFYI